MIIRRALTSVLLGVISFALAAVTAYLLLSLLFLTSFALWRFLHWLPFPLRLVFAVLTTLIPIGTGLVVLLASAVRLSAWRHLSPWPVVVTAALLAGLMVDGLLTNINELNACWFGVTFPDLGREKCENGFR